MIDMDVAKTFNILSAYFTATATISPPNAYKLNLGRIQYSWTHMSCIILRNISICIDTFESLPVSVQ